MAMLLFACLGFFAQDVMPASINGTWIVETKQVKGTTRTKESRLPFWDPMEFSIQESDIELRFTSKEKSRLTFSTTRSKASRTFDLNLSEKVVIRGIFLLDGDVLIVCYNIEPNGPRPTSFDTTKGDSWVVYLCRRK
jgi:uncharacterized protein (TIGR03067 family)